jgi:hypothetical protein
MLLDFIGFLLVGRLLVFFLQEFPFDKFFLIGGLFKEGKFLKQLLECDLCLGFWVYSFIAFAFGVDILKDMDINTLILGKVVTGAVASFIVHIFRIGWVTKFGVVIVENEHD